MANLPRTELNINQLFTIISQYHRKKLFSANDITYFLENLYPEVPVENYFSFESDYLTDTTLELFLNSFTIEYSSLNYLLTIHPFHLKFQNYPTLIIKPMINYHYRIKPSYWKGCTYTPLIYSISLTLKTLHILQC